MIESKSHRENIADGLWFSDDVMDARTLYFPNPMERVYTIEVDQNALPNCGSDDARISLRNLLAIGLSFACLLESLAVAAFVRDHSDGISFGLQAFFFVLGLTFGLVDLFFYLGPNGRFARAQEGKLAYYMGVPQIFIYLQLLNFMLRTENFSYPHDFFSWQVSPIGFNYAVSGVTIGLSMKFFPSFLSSGFFLFLIFIRALILFKYDTNRDSWVRCIGYIAPGAVAFFVNYSAMYLFEKSYRLKFLMAKRIEIETRRLEEQQENVKAILELVLPQVGADVREGGQGVIGITFCQDVISSFKQLNRIEPELAVRLLNTTFKSFDSLLREFPSVEKIKTISSKTLLLITSPTPDAVVAKHSDTITNLCLEVINRLIFFNHCDVEALDAVGPSRSISIGVAFGEIVAGIVGVEKFCYDVYGDIVNTETLWKSCGRHVVKGKGSMKIFYLNSSGNDALNESVRYSTVTHRSKVLINNDSKHPEAGLSDDPENPSDVETRRRIDIGLGGEALRAIIMSFNTKNAAFSSCRNVRLAGASNPKDYFMSGDADEIKARQLASGERRRSVNMQGKDFIGRAKAKAQMFATFRGVDMASIYQSIESLDTSADVGRKQLHTAAIEKSRPSQKFLNILNSKASQWTYIGRWSLMFLDPEIQQKYRDNVRKDVGHRLNTLFQEGCSATLICLSCIILGSMYNFVDSSPISRLVIIRQDGFTKNGLFPTQPWIGISIAVVGFILQMWLSWFHYFKVRHVAVRRPDPRSKVAPEGGKQRMEVPPFRGGLIFHYSKIITSFAVLLGVQITAYGNTWLSSQALMCLFLSYSANLDCDDVEPDIPFYAIACSIFGLSGITHALLAYFGITNFVDFLMIICLTMIVLTGKYRYSAAKRMNLLLSLKLIASQELQDVESDFFYRLLGAILPVRVTHDMLKNLESIGRVYLERFERCDISSRKLFFSSRLALLVATNEPKNFLFTEFDEICVEHQVEKILTIGDAYVAMRAPGVRTTEPAERESSEKRAMHPLSAANLPDDSQSLNCPSSANPHYKTDFCDLDRFRNSPTIRSDSSSLLRALGSRLPKFEETRKKQIAGDMSETNAYSAAALEVCLAALKMQDVVEAMVSEWTRTDEGQGMKDVDQFQKLKVRVGIHSGTAFGCVTGGTTKIKYELMGESIEVAEVIEQTAVPGTVRASLSTMLLITENVALSSLSTVDKSWCDANASTLEMYNDGKEIASTNGVSFIARWNAPRAPSAGNLRDREDGLNNADVSVGLAEGGAMAKNGSVNEEMHLGDANVGEPSNLTNTQTLIPETVNLKILGSVGSNNANPWDEVKTMNDGVEDIHERIAEELWFSDEIIDRHTLYFPATMERVFTIEHIGSEDSRINLRNLLYVGLVYYAISEGVAISAYVSGQRTGNGVSMGLELTLFLVTELVGMCNLRYCILNVERNENYCYPYEFFTWQVSSVGFIFVLSAAIIGLTFKFLPGSMMSAAILSIVLWRCLLLFAAESKGDYWIRSLGFVMPGIVTLIVNLWAMYLIEYSFRQIFITKKRLEIEMRRLQDRHTSVEGILELILPKNVITRLQTSNYNFSAVTDRFETAFAIFIDFVGKKTLDSLSPEHAVRFLNTIFKALDSVLQKFPEVDKIKTISSKTLLISKPAGTDEIQKCAAAITKLCYETLEKSRFANSMVSIGIAFGEIVAGIVGVEKFCYDVYGDVVNTASRMQTLGLKESVLCTEDSFAQFSEETRKGVMEVYYLILDPKQRKSRAPFGSSKDHLPDLPIYSISSLPKAPELSSHINDKNDLINDNDTTAFNEVTDKRSSLPTSPSITSIPQGTTFTAEEHHYSTTNISAGDDAVRAVLSSFHSTPSAGHGVFGSRRVRYTTAMESEPGLVTVGDLMDVLGGKKFDVIKREEISSHSLIFDPSLRRFVGVNRVGNEGKKNNDSYIAMMNEASASKDGGNRFDGLLKEFENVWKHVGKTSLVFLDPMVRKRYRRHVRKEEDHRLRSLLQESAAATMISGATIIIAWLYNLYADHDRRFTKIRARNDQIAREGLFRNAAVVGMGFSIGCFLLLMGASWSHYAWMRSLVDMKRRRKKQVSHANDNDKPSYRLPPLFSGWLFHGVKVLTALGVLVGVQVTPYGQVWLSPQAIICLFLSYAANLEFDFLEPDLPFHTTVGVIAVVTIVPNVVFYFYGMSTLSDMLRMGWMITIVLGGKYRHALARRGNFLLNVTLVKSRELQDLESEFVLELLGAILPLRAIDFLLMKSSPAGKSYLESFECVTVIHMDVTSFTVLSSTMSATDVIALLNVLFTQFDEICHSHSVEKILTIGDAYVAMRIPENHSIKETERTTELLKERKSYLLKSYSRAKNPSSNYSTKSNKHAVTDPINSVSRKKGSLKLSIRRAQTLRFDTELRKLDPSRGAGRKESFMSDIVDGEQESLLQPILEQLPHDSGNPFEDAAAEACHAALEMQEAVVALVKSWETLGSREKLWYPFLVHEGGENALEHLLKMRVRIGVHSGSAFGCLTGGSSKIKYEVVGEAMDIAEKMEQIAIPGTVRVSQSTMTLITGRNVTTEEGEDEARRVESVKHLLEFVAVDGGKEGTSYEVRGKEKETGGESEGGCHSGEGGATSSM
ncbi:hypothetical protein HDU67_006308 [Dinochytrium kinnereticum]|nr:hypothetical protein HDU67_006308 [Dinochytrium kinnereticum]